MLRGPAEAHGPGSKEATMTDTLTPATQPNDGDGYYERVAALVDGAVLAPGRVPRAHRPRAGPRLALGRGRARARTAPGSCSTRAPPSLQRRALLLRNPGLPGPGFGATHSLVAAYQMLLPGRVGPGPCPLVLGVALRGQRQRRPHGGGRSGRAPVPGRSGAHAGRLLARPRAPRRRRAGRLVRRPRRPLRHVAAGRLLPGGPLRADPGRAGVQHRDRDRRRRAVAGGGGRARGTRRCAATRGTRPIRPCSG